MPDKPTSQDKKRSSSFLSRIAATFSKNYNAPKKPEVRTQGDVSIGSIISGTTIVHSDTPGTLANQLEKIPVIRIHGESVVAGKLEDIINDEVETTGIEAVDRELAKQRKNTVMAISRAYGWMRQGIMEVQKGVSITDANVQRIFKDTTKFQHKTTSAIEELQRDITNLKVRQQTGGNELPVPLDMGITQVKPEKEKMGLKDALLALGLTGAGIAALVWAAKNWDDIVNTANWLRTGKRDQSKESETQTTSRNIGEGVGSVIKDTFDLFGWTGTPVGDWVQNRTDSSLGTGVLAGAGAILGKPIIGAALHPMKFAASIIKAFTAKGATQAGATAAAKIIATNSSGAAVSIGQMKAIVATTGLSLGTVLPILAAIGIPLLAYESYAMIDWAQEHGMHAQRPGYLDQWFAGADPTKPLGPDNQGIMGGTVPEGGIPGVTNLSEDINQVREWTDPLAYLKKGWDAVFGKAEASEAQVEKVKSDIEKEVAPLLEGVRQEFTATMLDLNKQKDQAIQNVTKEFADAISNLKADALDWLKGLKNTVFDFFSSSEEIAKTELPELTFQKYETESALPEVELDVTQPSNEPPPTIEIDTAPVEASIIPAIKTPTVKTEPQDIPEVEVVKSTPPIEQEQIPEVEIKATPTDGKEILQEVTPGLSIGEDRDNVIPTYEELYGPANTETSEVKQEQSWWDRVVDYFIPETKVEPVKLPDTEISKPVLVGAQLETKQDELVPIEFPVLTPTMDVPKILNEIVPNWSETGNIIPTFEELYGQGKLGEIPNIASAYGQGKLGEIPTIASAYGQSEADQIPTIASSYGQGKLGQIPTIASSYGQNEIGEIPNIASAYGQNEIGEIPNIASAYGQNEIGEIPNIASAYGQNEIGEIPAVENTYKSNVEPISKFENPYVLRPAMDTEQVLGDVASDLKIRDINKDTATDIPTYSEISGLSKIGGRPLKPEEEQTIKESDEKPAWWQRLFGLGKPKDQLAEQHQTEAAMREMMTRSQAQQEEMSWAERIPEQKGIFGMMGDIYGAVTGAASAAAGGLLGVGRRIGGALGGGGGSRGPSGPPPLSPERQAMYDEFLKTGVLSEEQMKELGWDVESLPSGIVKSVDPETGIVSYKADVNISREAAITSLMTDVRRGTEGLEGKSKLKKQVYDSFRNAGFSDDQAKALTAEVGRENDFNPIWVFGSHSDPANARKNTGFFSWQKSRQVTLEKELHRKGLINPDGTIQRSQTALDIMAKFARNEMETNSHGGSAAQNRRIQQFLNDPNIDSETAARILGKDFIRWKFDAFPSHQSKRRQYYEQIAAITGGFEGLKEGEVPTEGQIIEEVQRMTVAQRRELFSSELFRKSRYANSILGDAGIDSKEQFGITKSMGRQDPRITEIMKAAAEEFPLRVRLFSGSVGRTGAHGAGLAGDVQIYDENGVPIASYQNPGSADIYAMLAEKAREKQIEMYPELNNEFAWLGALHGMRRGGGGKYGAADFMDFRIGRVGNMGPDTMMAYKFGEGWQKGFEYYREGSYLGLDKKVGEAYTKEDFEKLKGLKLTPEQIEDQYRRAKRFGFNAGLLSHPKLSERDVQYAETTAKDVDLTRKDAETKPSGVERVLSAVGSALIPTAKAGELPGDNSLLGMATNAIVGPSKSDIEKDQAAFEPAPELAPIPELDTSMPEGMKDFEEMKDEVSQMEITDPALDVAPVEPVEPVTPAPVEQAPALQGEEVNLAVEPAPLPELSQDNLTMPNPDAASPTLTPELRTELTPGTIEEGPLQQTPVDKSGKRPSENQTGESSKGTPPATNMTPGSGTNIENAPEHFPATPGHRSGSGSGMGCHYCDM